MLSKEEINRRIARWARVTKTADGNPRMLIDNRFSEEAHRKAIDNVRTMYINESEMMSCISNVDELNEIPNVLLKYWGAKRKWPNCNCSLNADPAKVHPECRRRIRAFFKARAELVNYGLNLKLKAVTK